MPGMTLTVPSAGWSSHEDSGGEFNLSSSAYPGATIIFWIDPHPFKAGGHVGAARTPQELVTWFQADTDLVVSQAVTRTIAGGIEPLSVDLEESPTGPQEDPSCPGPCISYLSVKGPNFSFDYGTGYPEPVRLYFASIGSGSTAHTFVVSVDTPNATVFASITQVAQQMVDSIQFPAELPQA